MLSSEDSSELPCSLLPQLLPSCGYSSQHFRPARLCSITKLLLSFICKRSVLCLTLHSQSQEQFLAHSRYGIIFEEGREVLREEDQKRGRNFCKADSRSVCFNSILMQLSHLDCLNSFVCYA